MFSQLVPINSPQQNTFIENYSFKYIKYLGINRNIQIYFVFFCVTVHCWDFRRLLCSKISRSTAEELQFSQELLNNNFSNYSSWHYRSTLQKLQKDNVDYELTLVQNAVFTDPADSSAWFYLRRVLSNTCIIRETMQELLEKFEQLEELEPDCKCKSCFMIFLLSINNFFIYY